LAGLLRIEYSPTVWASIDRRAADLQDLFFNEPWFLVEGLGFGALGWIVLGSGRRRRWWVGTALAAISVLTVIGMLSATGVIGEDDHWVTGRVLAVHRGMTKTTAWLRARRRCNAWSSPARTGMA
jgi:hypothetical protein